MFVMLDALKCSSGVRLVVDVLLATVGVNAWEDSIGSFGRHDRW